MKTLLIGNTKCYSALRLQEEFHKRGLVFDMVPSASIVFEVLNNETFCRSTTGVSAADYDVLIFRGVGNRIKEFSVIARYFKKKGKVVVEDVLATKAMYMEKFSPTMVDDKVPTLDYAVLFDKKTVYQTHLEFPFIVKGLDGSMGKKVNLVHNTEEYRETIERYGYPVLLQQYVPITRDYRVMVVDGEVLGVMARSNTEKSFLTTCGGGKRECVELPEHALDIALRATKVSGLMVAGVDLLEWKGEYYMLEANMSPQFRVFERVTGVNVAEKILEAIVRRYEHAKES